MVEQILIRSDSEPAAHQNGCHLLAHHFLKDACVPKFVLPGYAEYAFVEGVKPFLLGACRICSRCRQNFWCISRCCFVEYDKEMHGNSSCTCSTCIFSFFNQLYPCFVALPLPKPSLLKLPNGLSEPESCWDSSSNAFKRKPKVTFGPRHSHRHPFHRLQNSRFLPFSEGAKRRKRSFEYLPRRWRSQKIRLFCSLSFPPFLSFLFPTKKNSRFN